MSLSFSKTFTVDRSYRNTISADTYKETAKIRTLILNRGIVELYDIKYRMGKEPFGEEGDV